MHIYVLESQPGTSETGAMQTVFYKKHCHFEAPAQIRVCLKTGTGTSWFIIIFPIGIAIDGVLENPPALWFSQL